jgi:hypothetical protein
MALSKIKGTVIADDAINADRIADGTVVASDLLDNTITGAKLATDIAISTSGNITTTGALTSTGIDDNATSTAITINSSEQVGIGTASPTSKLQVEGSTTINSTGSPPLTIHHTDGNTVALAFKNNASDNHSLMFTDGDFRINYDGSEKMRINSDGEIAMGTTTPTTLANLTLSGKGFTAGGADSGSIAFGHTPAYQGRIYQVNATSIFYIENTYGSNSGDIRFKTNGSERVTIEGTGNVGIGTTSPNETLQIHFPGSGSSFLQLTNTDTGSSDNNGLYVGVISGGNAYVGLRDTNGSDLLFQTENTERMRIDSSGNVGIGTSSPSQKLQVLGDIQFGTSTSKNFLGDFGTTDLYLINNNSGTMRFHVGGGTSADEHMRIDSSGRLLLGTTSATGVAGTGMAITSGVSGGDDGALHLKGGSGDFTAFSFHDSPINLKSVISAATDQFRITSSTNGTIMAFLDDGRINAPLVYDDAVTGRDLYISSSGQIGYLSSVRDSKTNIENISDVSWLYQLNPVSFNYKVQDEQGNYTEEAQTDKFYGLIAEEVEPINPDICFYKNDNPEDGLAGVDYKKLYAPMIKALQEQQTKIEELEARITTLEANNP